MQLLAIKNNEVIAEHGEHHRFSQNDYPGCELVFYEGSYTYLGDDDPRTSTEKAQIYKSKRKLEYPEIEDQLDMIYWDKVNGTTVWQDAIAAIKAKHPKP